jgi:hypothetical protein
MDDRVEITQHRLAQPPVAGNQELVVGREGADRPIHVVGVLGAGGFRGGIELRDKRLNGVLNLGVRDHSQGAEGVDHRLPVVLGGGGDQRPGRVTGAYDVGHPGIGGRLDLGGVLGGSRRFVLVVGRLQRGCFRLVGRVRPGDGGGVSVVRLFPFAVVGLEGLGGGGLEAVLNLLDRFVEGVNRLGHRVLMHLVGGLHLRRIGFVSRFETVLECGIRRGERGGVLVEVRLHRLLKVGDDVSDAVFQTGLGRGDRCEVVGVGLRSVRVERRRQGCGQGVAGCLGGGDRRVERGQFGLHGRRQLPDCAVNCRIEGGVRRVHGRIEAGGCGGKCIFMAVTGSRECRFSIGGRLINGRLKIVIGPLQQQGVGLLNLQHGGLIVGVGLGGLGGVALQC